MSIEKHTHQYVRIKVGRNKRIEYKCALPGCVHKVRAEYIEGRISVCYRCGEEFILTKHLLQKRARPHCANCTVGTKKKQLDRIAALLGGK